MSAYYNEYDPFAAAWLRELIKDGLIADGEVDERSIEDVTPDELRPFRQCHFFAGIGVWSLAARRAGWSDDEALWSGSCPCQPFSAAGKGGGFADERHLWPSFHYLIEQCRPSLVVGEQVAGNDGDSWFDLVSADLDATGYAFGACETVAAGFGAPHKRTRNYWVARDLGDANGSRLAGSGSAERDHVGTDGQAAPCGPVVELAEPEDRGGRGLDGIVRGSQDEIAEHGGSSLGSRGEAGGMDDSTSARLVPSGSGEPSEIESDGSIGRSVPSRGCESLGMADAHGRIERDRNSQSSEKLGLLAQDGSARRQGNSGTQSELADRMERPGPSNGLWRNADWLLCRDEKWRPVESGTFPLVDAGTFRNRVGLLRGAGNAITLGQAEGFLRAVRLSLF